MVLDKSEIISTMGIRPVDEDIKRILAQTNPVLDLNKMVDAEVIYLSNRHCIYTMSSDLADLVAFKFTQGDFANISKYTRLSACTMHLSKNYINIDIRNTPKIEIFTKDINDILVVICRTICINNCIASDDITKKCTSLEETAECINNINWKTLQLYGHI